GDGGRHRDQLRGRRRGQLQRPLRGALRLRARQGRGDGVLRGGARDRPRRLLRLLGLPLRPADAARCRQPGRGQPRPAPGGERQAGGLAGAALRTARAAAAGAPGYRARDRRRADRLPRLESAPRDSPARPPPAPVTPRAWLAFAAISLLWGVPYLFIKIAV